MVNLKTIFRSREMLLTLGIIAVITVIGVLLNQPYLTLSTSLALIYILMAMGWDFSSGTTNYVNFGLPFFLGIGALTTGYFSYTFHLPIPLLLVLAFVFGTIGGFLFTIPTLRLRGPFFTLLSLLLPLIGLDFVVSFWIVLKMPTQGYYGLPFISSNIDASMITLSITAMAVVIVLYTLRRSHLGLLLKGIGDDEEAMLSQGVNTFPVKVLAFSISMGIVGLAGGFYALLITYAGVDVFGLSFLLYPMLISILGGRGTILGSVPAGLIIILLSQYLNLYVGQLTLIIFVVLTLLIFLFLPRGISRFYHEVA